jgi:hypothetical protein
MVMDAVRVACSRVERAYHTFVMAFEFVYIAVRINVCKLVTKERALGEIWGSHGFHTKYNLLLGYDAL